jgi:ParB family chromosome partitioning protein
VSRAKRPALGRGLGALLPSKPAAPAPAAALPGPAAAIPTGGGQREVDIEQVTPNPDQPRKHFDPGALEELAASIRTQGILQPLVVSAAPAGDDGRPRYLIVAGERRWRAAQKAGLHRVPVVVKDVAANERLEVALIENIQRADLNPIEEARAYADLTRLRGYTQDELAARVGKDRSTVSNAMRLLRLPDKVQTLVVQGRLSMGHARALLGLTHEDEMHAVATDILRDNLSVRATEAAVRKAVRDRRATDEPGDDDEAERRKIIVAELENRLRRRLGARVRLRAQGSRGAGTVEIPYATLDELDRLLRILLGKHDAVE